MKQFRHHVGHEIDQEVSDHIGDEITAPMIKPIQVARETFDSVTGESFMLRH